ncbi:MAG: amylo-alpha-1,6-glucosidase [Thermodesulfobacteriota bacterium]
MSEIIQVHDQFYILVTAALDPDRTRVLKHGDTFLIVDRQGDVRPIGLGTDGLFHEGTRFLSRMELDVQSLRFLLLSSTVQDDNAVFVANLTNPDLALSDASPVQRDTVHVLRSLLLWNGTLYQELRLRSYQPEPVSLRLGVTFGSDFADMFEVRGTRRAARGRHDPGTVQDGEIVLRYHGLDRVVRRTRIVLDPPATITQPGRAEYALTLEAHEDKTLHFAISCEIEPERRTFLPFGDARRAARAAIARNATRGCSVRTSNDEFNQWLDRSVADLAMMTSQMPTGVYPYAGVPWFCCPFGRDGIITALEVLWCDPELARGVLAFLAATQATEASDVRDAEPGKILHESRSGEMAALGEIPFGRYYGSADSTPLFVFLASEYWRRTGDRLTIETLWPNLQRALEWIDRYGDLDGDGFVEYAAHLPTGLRQQGWKDSDDSVMHADGTLAAGPIALCEIQAYVYAAKLGAAILAQMLGDDATAARLRREASRLRERFEEAFWDEDLGSYVLALDGAKEPCRVRSSNAGHCLYAGIAAPDRARRVARRLTDPDSFSGWGIRTLAGSERRYNPMSYHNGSVWPHDNALLAAGMARYQQRHQATAILAGLYDASRFFALRRLPELFCGFPRRPGEGPTLYPVACAPQTWAAGAPFMALAAALGISIDGPGRRVVFGHSMLPPFLPHVEVRNLRVGEGTIDVAFHRHGDDVGVNVLRREGDIEVVAVK